VVRPLEEIGEYRCEICDARFKDPDALAKHMAIHEAKGKDREDEEEPEDREDQEDSGGGGGGAPPFPPAPSPAPEPPSVPQPMQ
jgi:hypothetical protein